jgi:integrase
MPTALANIRREHVESFIAAKLQAWKPYTALNRHRGLTVSPGWLVQEREIEPSPMANMKPPHMPEESPTAQADAELRRLLKACEGPAFTAKRDMAIVRLPIETGMRRTEIPYRALLTRLRDDPDGIAREPGKARYADLIQTVSHHLPNVERAAAMERKASGLPDQNIELSQGPRT